MLNKGEMKMEETKDNANKPKESADKMLNKMVLATMTRYNDLTENEYLKCLGVDLEKFPNIKEDYINNVALCNMLLSLQRKLLKLNTDLKALCGSIDAKQKITQYNETKVAKRREKKNGNKR